MCYERKPSISIQGPVSFRNRQRQAETVLSQFQIDMNEEQIQIIAEYSRLKGFNSNCSSCQSLLWPGQIHIDISIYLRLCCCSGLKPVDTERHEIRRVVLNKVEISVITVACIFGLVLASFFLTFNIIYRHER
jgi:hypothetical protein